MTPLRASFPKVTVALLLAVAALTAPGGIGAPVSSARAAVTFPTYASGLSSPVFVTHARDSRLFIVEQTGKIRIRHRDNTITTFLDLSRRISCCGERGLLSMAFHPDYAKPTSWGSGRFYVNYTDPNGDIVIAEYRRHRYNVAATTERRLLTIRHSTYSNHNGGLVAFGPDQYLYISTGDGGGAGDPLENAQNRYSLLGKMLRIAPYPSSTRPYTIPTSNPYCCATVAGADQVWARGLRNPWRFSFDRETGDLWIGDVGQGRWEEINLATTASGRGRGVNYGWDVLEGPDCYEPPNGCSSAGMTAPVHWYGHGGGRCSVTGGYVSRGPSSALAGRYLFADYCTGEIFTRTSTGSTSLLTDTTMRISSLGEGFDGTVYVVNHAGSVHRIAVTP